MTIGRWICKQIQSLGGGSDKDWANRAEEKCGVDQLTPFPFGAFCIFQGLRMAMSIDYIRHSTHPKSSWSVYYRGPQNEPWFSSFWLNASETTHTHTLFNILQFHTHPFGMCRWISIVCTCIYIYNHAHTYCHLQKDPKSEHFSAVTCLEERLSETCVSFMDWMVRVYFWCACSVVRENICDVTLWHFTVDPAFVSEFNHV